MKKILMTAVAAVMATIGTVKADLPDYTMKFFVGGNAPLTWSFNNGLTLKHFSYNANTNVLSIGQNGINYSYEFASDEEWLPANDVREINGKARMLNNPSWMEGTYIGVDPVTVDGVTVDFPVGVTLGADGSIKKNGHTLNFYLTDGDITVAFTINISFNAYIGDNGAYEFSVFTGNSDVAPAPGSYNPNYENKQDGITAVMEAISAAWAEYLGYK